MQISLDVRNENLSEKRIHQICAWTPAPLPGWADAWSLEPDDWRRRCGDLVAQRIAFSCHFDCCRIVIFFSPLATTAEV
jgi:hypothetical protein